MITASRLKYIIPFYIIYMFTAIIMLAPYLHFGIKDFDVDADDLSTSVAAADYEKICIGMSYGEVCDLLGAEGSKSQMYGSSINGTTYYVWPGEYNKKGVVSSEVTIGIDNESGRTCVIRERNLIRGKEVLESKENSKAAKSDVLYDDATSMIKEGMTYEEIVKIMGTEGALTESQSKLDIYNGKQIEGTYEWECKRDSEEATATVRIRIDFTDGKVRHIKKGF